MNETLKKIVKDIEHLSWYEKIGYLRRLQGIKKGEMVRKCSTYRANYKNWESGKVYPSKLNRILIARGLNVVPSVIFKKSDVRR